LTTPTTNVTKNLIPKRTGETFRKVDNVCFFVSKGVLAKCPCGHVTHEKLRAVRPGQLICLDENCGNVTPRQLKATDESIPAASHTCDLVRVAHKNEERVKRQRCVESKWWRSHGKVENTHFRLWNNDKVGPTTSEGQQPVFENRIH
jgi:hypothetical protein